MQIHRIKKLLFLLLIYTLTILSCIEKKTFAKEEPFAALYNKKKVTVAITDSGLGGLSIAAESMERMKEAKIFQKVNFIFFNALFSNEIGYNGLQNRQEKINVFDSALHSLENKCNPDLILIGCNTLSALYKETPFSKQTQIPVVGIVDYGVELIATNLKVNPESKVILFGTQTTVKEGIHKKKLMEKGFLEERIIAQACPDLGLYIERGFDSDETEMLIFAYADEALQKDQNHHGFPVFVSLNCTHYGYSLDLWKKAFKSLGVTPLAILNPNSGMIDFLFQEQMKNRSKSTETTMKVISMVKIEKGKLKSIGAWLEGLSSQTAEALRNYKLNKKLFEWKKFVSIG